jgi:CDP-paratose 2-epimerase
MKVIVTGVAGFIGSHVATRFLSQGATVVGIDNLSRPGSRDNLNCLADWQKQLVFHHTDVRSATDMAGLFAQHQDTDVVIHEAAQVAVTSSVSDPRTDFEVNALGTFNVLEAARQYTPQAVFLYASTNKVYGQLEHLCVREGLTRYEYTEATRGIDESESMDFHSPYGCSKGCAEQYVRDYHRIYGLKSVVFRQSCVYGTRQFGVEDQGWVAWFIIASVLGRPLTIYGDGKQLRDLLWVDDLIDLYLKAIASIETTAGQIYNAGGGASNTLSLLELLDILRSYLGRSIAVRFSAWRPGDQKVFVSDCEKARRELGWSPKTAPVEGVTVLLRWAEESRDLLARLNSD